MEYQEYNKCKKLNIDLFKSHIKYVKPALLIFIVFFIIFVSLFNFRQKQMQYSCLKFKNKNI